MSEPVRKSVYQVVKNMLTVLAEQGDIEAIAALKRADDLDLIEEAGDEADDVTVIISQAKGDYLITEQGATLIPREE